MSSFSIPDVPPKTELTKGKVSKESGKNISPHTGFVQFSINNDAGEILEGNVSVQPDGKADSKWFSIAGEAKRDFKISESNTVDINISVPADAPQGDYSFRLLVASVNDPDNEFAISASTAFTVPAPEAVGGGGGGGSKWWLWVLLGILALAIIGGIAWAVIGGGDEEKPQPKPTEQPSPTTLTVPDLKGQNIKDLPKLAEGFDLIQQAGAPAGNAPGTILTQNPEPGAPPQQKNALLKVTYDPGVQVPDLRGMTTDQAIRALRPNLFVEDSLVRCENTGVTGQIVDHNPKPKTFAAQKTGVVVWVRVVNTSTLKGVNCSGRFRIEDIQRLQATTTTVTPRLRDATVLNRTQF